MKHYDLRDAAGTLKARLSQEFVYRTSLINDCEMKPYRVKGERDRVKYVFTSDLKISTDDTHLTLWFWKGDYVVEES